MRSKLAKAFAWAWVSVMWTLMVLAFAALVGAILCAAYVGIASMTWRAIALRVGVLAGVAVVVFVTTWAESVVRGQNDA